MVAPGRAAHLTDLVCRLAAAGGQPPNRVPLAESIAAWSERTASMAETLLRDNSEGLAASRAVIMVTFDDLDSEAAVQVLCLEPAICERVATMLQTYLLQDTYDADEQQEALTDAVSRTADIVIDGLIQAGSSAGSVTVSASIARQAVLHLLYDVLYLDPEGGGRTTIDEIEALSPGALDQLTRALWPIHVAQADALRLSLPEMEYIARLHAQSPAIAVQAAEFFAERAEVDPLALQAYLRDGTVLTDGVR